MNFNLTTYQVEEMCNDFKALADQTRMRIILCLLSGEKSVNEISVAVKMSQSATSHQLRILKDYRVLKCKKQGTVNYYRIADEHVKTIIEMSIKHLECNKESLWEADK